MINLKTNTFETLEVADLVRKHGAEMPLIEKMVSVYDGHHLRRPMGMQLDFEKDTVAFTFEGLLSDSPFVKQVHAILRLLEEKLGTPVDIEFAHDGTNFYLLQCRPQSYSQESGPAPIPKDVPADRVIFTANRYISNGRVRDITHIVYVDPLKYGDLPSRDDLVAVGRAVGKLNKLLPKRQFVLMGPGRWGSRGDIKLGVSVTYSEINNTAALIEIARKKGNYSPDLSFGTHFFQDLVEGQIRYLPLFPDDEGIIFNERFLNVGPQHPVGGRARSTPTSPTSCADRRAAGDRRIHPPRADERGAERGGGFAGQAGGRRRADRAAADRDRQAHRTDLDLAPPDGRVHCVPGWIRSGSGLSGSTSSAAPRTRPRGSEATSTS